MVWGRLFAVLVLFATVAFTATASVGGTDTDGAVAVAPSAPSAPDRERPSPRVPAPALDRSATAVTTSSPVATPAPSPTAVPGHADAPTRPADPESARAHVVNPGSRLAVGALFSGDGHYCSASVVDSPNGNLVVTA